MSYYSELTLSFALITLLILLPSSSSTTLLITKTCKQITQGHKINDDLYTTCVDLLESDSRSENATKVDQLGVIAFELTEKKIVATRKQILGLSKSSKYEAVTKAALEFCAEMYSDSADDLSLGLESYRMKDFKAANSQTSGAMEGLSTCEDEFAVKVDNAVETNSLLMTVNNDMYQLCIIPLIFTVIT